MNVTWPESETDVARPFAAWMRSMDYEVFPEVRLRLSGRADIVGRRQFKRQTLYHAVEVKRSFGWSVLNQAIAHTAAVHYASIVVPKMKNSAYNSRAASTVLRHWGVGLYVIERSYADSYGGGKKRGVIRLEGESCAHTEAERGQGHCNWGADEPGGCEYGYRVKEVEKPKKHRIKQHFIDRYVNLTERHKGAVPGNADSDYWTPWRETCHRVEKFVGENPGCTTTELIEGIEHHYRNDSSARSSIPQWIRAGKIDVDIRKEGGRLYFYPPDSE